MAGVVGVVCAAAHWLRESSYLEQLDLSPVFQARAPLGAAAALVVIGGGLASLALAPAFLLEMKRR